MEDQAPETFPFPFEPYEIQLYFMKNLYKTISVKRSGIFESPTGTGKSLSICCGVLQWLRNYQNHILESLELSIISLRKDLNDCDGSDNWLEDQYSKIQKTKELNEVIKKLDRINKAKAEILLMKERVMHIKNIQDKDLKKAIVSKKFSVPSEKSDELIDEIQSGDIDFIVSDNDDDESSDYESDEEIDIFPKIYFASRTHSQLSQFISEIKKTSFAENTRVVTLASRQHYCINEEVLKLKSINLINERCLDMQKSKSKQTSKDENGKITKKMKTGSCYSCPYYNQTNIGKLKESLLVEILDIEDIVKAGKKLKACPYYASRAALKEAEVVLLSHAGIVSSGARAGMSLKLKDNVLIVDEAHGLITAIEQAHTASLTAKGLNDVIIHMDLYIEKYKPRFSSKNLLTLNQILFVIKKLLNSTKTKEQAKTEIFTLESYVIQSEIDHFNFKPLIDFCKLTKLPQKLHGFCMWRLNHPEEIKTPQIEPNKKLQQFLSSLSKKKPSPEPVMPVPQNKPVAGIKTESSAGSTLYIVLNFLEMLCNKSNDGRILVLSSNCLQGQLKYLLLNPAAQFSQVVQECRSVILAGGTMKPIQEFQNLLHNTKETNLVFCDHVVPSENILAVCLSRGPSNKSLNFSFENRNSKELLDETCRAICNICSVVPGGVICFLPSYSYEKVICDHMSSTQIFQSISKRKKIFREPKNATEVEKLLKDFTSAVKNKENGNTGALLLSVVGGKLSEGLNFSDDLGRCVIVVGLPYPNIKSMELQEKMKYLNKNVGPNEGNIYYEGLCMKAVNQCIGRAIRHINDYACMILMDERFSRPNISASLPTFVQKSLHINMNFGATFGSIAKFFSKRKS